MKMLRMLVPVSAGAAVAAALLIAAPQPAHARWWGYGGYGPYATFSPYGYGYAYGAYQPGYALPYNPPAYYAYGGWNIWQW